MSVTYNTKLFIKKENKMSLIKCKDCNSEISQNASACPHCGAVVINPKTEAFKIIKQALIWPNFFGIMTLLISSAEPRDFGTQVKSVDFLPIAALTLIFIIIGWNRRRAEKKHDFVFTEQYSNWKIYLAFLPAWIVFVLSFTQALFEGIQLGYGIVITNISGIYMLTGLIIFMVAYRPFLKIFRFVK